jgi:hypothetical protein
MPDTPNSSPPIQPVKPDSMELLFFYPCPHCGGYVPLITPVQPLMVRCEGCRKRFHIVPVDGRSVEFLKLMLDNGRAAIDADYA